MVARHQPARQSHRRHRHPPRRGAHRRGARHRRVPAQRPDRERERLGGAARPDGCRERTVRHRHDVRPGGLRPEDRHRLAAVLRRDVRRGRRPHRNGGRQRRPRTGVSRDDHARGRHIEGHRGVHDPELIRRRRIPRERRRLADPGLERPVHPAGRPAPRHDESGRRAVHRHLQPAGGDHPHRECVPHPVAGHTHLPAASARSNPPPWPSPRATSASA